MDIFLCYNLHYDLNSEVLKIAMKIVYFAILAQTPQVWL